MGRYPNRILKNKKTMGFKKVLKYRMYFLTMYNISQIQIGIQAGHSSLEYVEEFGDSLEYRCFIENDKTWIILNGGTSGDMLTHYNYLKNDVGIDVSYFNEPDLNMSLSAICFLADERVWDKETYPDYEEALSYNNGINGVLGCSTLWEVEQMDNRETCRYNAWVELIGGEENVKLREFLKNKRLA